MTGAHRLNSRRIVKSRRPKRQRVRLHVPAVKVHQPSNTTLLRGAVIAGVTALGLVTWLATPSHTVPVPPATQTQTVAQVQPATGDSPELRCWTPNPDDINTALIAQNPPAHAKKGKN